MERASSSSSYSSSSSIASSSCDHTLSDQTLPYMTSSMLSRTTSSSSSSVAGDYLGTESCFDILSAEEENDLAAVSPPPESFNRYRYGGRRKEEREARAAAAREFPPPIPLLAQTENLLPHMPWVLKRVVTSDGRLILREEKVRHHEYFRAHRSNGRLTLHLVHLDDDVLELPHYESDDECYDETDEQECEEDVDDVVDSVDDIVDASDDDDVKDNVHGDDSEKGCIKSILAAVAEETVVEMVGGGGSPRGKCLKSCFVGMTVREIRPVLS